MENVDYSHIETNSSPQGFKNILFSLLGGSLGGVSSIVIGHPLDTLKVRMQMLNLRAFECCRVMIKSEGFSSFFKGLASPLITAPLAYSAYMGLYDLGRSLQGVGYHEQMTVLQASLAGVFVGGIMCMIGTPVELVKCRLQVEVIPKNGQATKMSHMVKTIFKEEGIRGLYRGNLATLMRDAPGSGIYFGSYELAKIKLNKWFGESAMNPLLAGGFAGLSYTVLIYPVDVIKTRLQCDTPGKYPEHKWLKDGGIISCAKQMWRTEGMRIFWRGLGPMGVRAVVGESVHFFMYEQTKIYFADHDFSSKMKGLQNIFSSFIAGNLGGIGTVISGHPLDTVKVRMQVLNLKFIQCCKLMIKNEGFSSFFKGVAPPLVTAPVIYSVYMSAYDTGRMLQGVGYHDQLTVSQAFLAGSFAGIVFPIIGTPIDLLKSRLQMEIQTDSGRSTKTRHMIKSIVRKEGFKGLYRGYLATALYEIPGSGIYFGAYEYAKIKLNSWFGQHFLNLPAAGAFAGLTYNCTIYPFDVVRIRLQVSERSKFPCHKWIKDGGIVSCVKYVYETEGISAFWRGLRLSAARSMLIQAVNFFIYEEARKYFAIEEGE